MIYPELPSLPPADGSVNFGYGDQPAWARFNLQEYARAAVQMDRDKRKAYEARRDAEPCEACKHDDQSAGLLPVFDCEGRCSRCDWQGTISHLHTCKTGWRKPVCGNCNKSVP